METTNKSLWSRINRHRYLYLMVLPGFLTVLIFNYFPMYGILIAFKKYSVVKGIMDSPWVGFKYFNTFFHDPLAFRVLKNTLLLGLYTLLWSFPAPIILALLFNELRNKRFKKIVQTVSYFPHFISVVIVAGMIKEFTARDGLFNDIISFFGGSPVMFLLEPGYFRTIFISSGIWQGVGFGTIIYLAALSGIDPTLYDVAEVDGANRWKKIVHITWPSLRSTTVILLIFAVGGILGSDFQKIILLYSPETYSVADVIGSYVYRQGILGAQYEYTTAIGLFMSVISFVILYLTNWISRKVSDTSLF
ncbi:MULTISPECIES: ABC transporter permease subunit [unclassified Paenibacillus]|uniref:ABC transporter permease n=1 Tax=unclassified Paenibacillus TaxID=185978 RepID=UPI001042C425|nr:MULTISPECIES: ABC transporter permease subunit [unclassified Paenibacillus]NIK68148.1 putative aldouronate transport system permease protein [Paenibacillus sp. BK720]TCM99634.1 putative aldouronate transport system permease protein [Paenibacillus sp. BK033]